MFCLTHRFGVEVIIPDEAPSITFWNSDDWHDEPTQPSTAAKKEAFFSHWHAKSRPPQPTEGALLMKQDWAHFGTAVAATAAQLLGGSDCAWISAMKRVARR